MISRAWAYYGDEWHVVELIKNHRGETEYLIPGDEYERSKEWFDAIEPFNSVEPVSPLVRKVTP